jgi:2-aminobenzoate-CoA ligase
MSKSQIDTFVRDRLSPAEQQPEFLFELPEFNYPGRLTDTGKLQRFALKEPR